MLSAVIIRVGMTHPTLCANCGDLWSDEPACCLAPIQRVAQPRMPAPSRPQKPSTMAPR